MTYPDDQLVRELRGLGNDISLTLDMVCETIHDNPEMAAAALDGDQHGVQHLVDKVREDHGLTPPMDEDLVMDSVKLAVKRVEKEEGE